MAEVVPISTRTYNLAGCTTEAWPNVGPPREQPDLENETHDPTRILNGISESTIEERCPTLKTRNRNKFDSAGGNRLQPTIGNPKKHRLISWANDDVMPFQLFLKHPPEEKTKRWNKTDLTKIVWDFPLPSWILPLQSKETSEVVLRCVDIPLGSSPYI